MKTTPLVEPSFSRIAHDLRGPLMPLRTAAWLLRHEHEARERILDLADIVDRQSVRLARMMDELNDWGRVTERPAGPRREPLEVQLAVDIAIGGFPDCQLEPVMAEDAATFPLRADPHDFGQLLHTLIEHAIHRAPDHLPEVALDVVSHQLHIRVRDHGPPLDAVSREALLTRPQAAPFDEGLGLRLLLARKIAEAHGGSIEIDDTIQDGLALLCVFPGLEADAKLDPAHNVPIAPSADTSG